MSEASVPTRITEAEIRNLVFDFYGRVQKDALLGPVFNRRIGNDWESHLVKMCDFWSSILLATGRFRGNPIQTHAQVPGITGAHFDRWLELFEDTAFDVLDPLKATDVVARSARMRLVLEPTAGAQTAES